VTEAQGTIRAKNSASTWQPGCDVQEEETKEGIAGVPGNPLAAKKKMMEAHHNAAMELDAWMTSSAKMRTSRFT